MQSETNIGFLSLGVAVVENALIESKSRSDIKRLRALTWLLSKDCIALIDCMPVDYSLEDWICWVLEGAPKRRQYV